jgi:hypothetical protein
MRTGICKNGTKNFMCKQFTPLSKVWLQLYPFLYFFPSFNKKGQNCIYDLNSSLFFLCTDFQAESSRKSVKYRISPKMFEKCENLSRNLLPLELLLYCQSADFCDTHSSLTTFDRELSHRVS